ncbi:MAG: nucleotide exchange factor GrpE, partial [Burkholderiales bacterium]|nr:nucleotide exchange factor GrpE [Burkholderiales bacterium]
MTDPHAIPPSASPDHDSAAATHFDTAGQAPVTPEQAIEARLAEAEARAAEYMDLALRSRAELDNL